MGTFTSQRDSRSHLSVLLWVPIIFLNMVLVVGFQVLFIHTIAGPLTATKMEEQPFFSGKELLVGTGSWRDSLFEDGDGSAYVLYRDSDGVRKIVRVDQNRFLNRLGVARFSAIEAPEPQDGSEIAVRMRNYLGYTDVTLVGDSVADLSSQLLYRDANSSFAAIILWALVLQSVEALAYGCLRAARGRARAASGAANS